MPTASRPNVSASLALGLRHRALASLLSAATVLLAGAVPGEAGQFVSNFNDPPVAGVSSAVTPPTWTGMSA
jgi:hypothetical protein